MNRDVPADATSVPGDGSRLALPQRALAELFAPWVQATVLRAGKALAFGEIDLRCADDCRSVSRATTTYAPL